MPSPLPDARARETILNDLDRNLVVEAAAGTGKTTCLVGRLVTLFRRGALAGEARLAAVTFTTKAAAELRERLEARLAERRADPDLDPAERAHLDAAAAALPECHIGTIHSFCARLIRERPVEAGVGPDFTELDDDADALLVRQAWELFSARLLAGGHPDVRDALERHDLDLESLYPGFQRFVSFPDIERWPGEDYAGDCDSAAFVDAVRRYNADQERFRAELDACDPGKDGLLALLQRLGRRCSRLGPDPDYRECYRLAGLFKAAPNPVKSKWRALGLSNEEATEEHEAYARFFADHVKPFLDGCRARVYAAALAGFRAAAAIYDAMRRERRVLNFQDLLLAAARLLRDHPAARAALAARYRRLLVDEVQDTDPIQAEIMFLLAADDPTESDWRRCRLRPGALFMVGDPKQSIYRFRRADIEVYQEMRRLVTDQGGLALGLSANFRSHPRIIDWVNRTYGPTPMDRAREAEEMALTGRFPHRESPYNPAYIPLESGAPVPAGECFSGVYFLQTLGESRRDGAVVGPLDVRRDEAARIAAVIRHAVDTGLALPDRGGVRPARPGDFLIVTPGKATVALYADAVRRLGLPCQASGGPQLAASRSLGLLSTYLAALARPDDPVRLLAALRSGLFGVADTELYAWKRAGGEFDFRAAPPDPAPDGNPLAGILAALRGHAGLFAAGHPLPALERVIADLGLWELAALGEDASQAVGALAEAVELLRRDASRLPTPGDLAQRLDELRAAYTQDPAPALGDDPDAVRVMNLHKTKGLEAPVVFLTCTVRQVIHHAAFSVRRRVGRAEAVMAVMGGEYGNTPLVYPLEWEKAAEEEELFLAAERTRLHYVAATRAGAALVVSVHPSGNAMKSGYLPHFLPGETIAQPLPEPDGPPAARAPAEPPAPPPDRGTAEAGRERRRHILVAPGYAAEQAKPEAAGARPERGVSDLAPDVAVRLGEALHALLAAPDGAAPVADVLAEYDLPADLAAETAAMVASVRASALWARAAAADQCFREAPFTLAEERNGLPTLVHGVIDLAFREGDAWVVADYKSDTLPPDADPAREALRHREQLHTYARAWERITGGRVAESGVFFVRAGVYAPLPPPGEG